MERIILNIIETVADKQVEKTDLLTDLDIDSLDKMDIIVAVEKEFNIQIPDIEIEYAQTVGDIVKLALERL